MLTPVEMLWIGYVMGAASVALPLWISTRGETSRKRRRRDF